MTPQEAKERAKEITGPFYIFMPRGKEIPEWVTEKVKNGLLDAVAQERLRSKINKKTRCIEWPGCLNGKGYGIVNLSRERRMMAHRVIYQGVYGKILDDRVVDHICRNKRCINIKHIRLITNKENVLIGDGITAQNLRKELCKRGHTLSYKRNGHRFCKTCKANWQTAQAIRRRKP